jgi:WD40 repeat protein
MDSALSLYHGTKLPVCGTCRGRLLAELKGHQNIVRSASFSPDGQRIVTVGSDGTVKLWQMGGLDQLLTRGCNWLKDYFVVHPEEREKLHVCQKR